MNTISIQVPSIAENIRMIESFIDNAKERFDLDDDIYGNIMIAVTEAVNNAIKHGNAGDKKKNVHLSLSLNESLIKFVVKDEGVGFDYQNLPDPTAPENLEKVGGRGIFLMKHLSDQVEFKDHGRIVELSFYMNA
jgi:serine/threonine-protein kinase RsbW